MLPETVYISKICTELKKDGTVNYMHNDCRVFEKLLSCIVFCPINKLQFSLQVGIKCCYHFNTTVEISLQKN